MISLRTFSCVPGGRRITGKKVQALIFSAASLFTARITDNPPAFFSENVTADIAKFLYGFLADITTDSAEFLSGFFRDVTAETEEFLSGLFRDVTAETEEFLSGLSEKRPPVRSGPLGAGPQPVFFFNSSYAAIF